MDNPNARQAANKIIKALDKLSAEERYAAMAVVCMLLGAMPEAKAFTDRADAAQASKLPA